jgi:3-isopropylmalate/(R)-2-methylmalate dehydratase small subunit
MLDQSDELRVRRVRGVVSTDDILAARIKHQHVDPREFARHVFAAYAPELTATLRSGDIIVGDSVFGIGSSREQAVTALVAAGVAAVVAPAFGTIFFRNAWNSAMPAIELDAPDLAEGDTVRIDLSRARLTSARGELAFRPPPPLLLDVLRAGGLLASVASRLRDSRSGEAP